MNCTAKSGDICGAWCQGELFAERGTGYIQDSPRSREHLARAGKQSVLS